MGGGGAGGQRPPARPAAPMATAEVAVALPVEEAVAVAPPALAVAIGISSRKPNKACLRQASPRVRFLSGEPISIGSS